MSSAQFTGPEANARRRAGEPALLEGDRELTWGRWDDEANRLAEALARRGVGPGDRVGVAMANRLEWFVTNAALGKLGAVQVAVNHRLAPAELDHVARDSGMTAVIGELREGAAGFAALAAAGVGLAVRLDREYPDLVAATEPVERVAPRRPGLVVYTSGTTGRPKGALRDGPSAPPEVFADYAASVRFDDDSAGPGYRALINMPLHHSAGPSHATRCCSAGGVAVLQRRFDAEDALRLIERHRISHWHAVPTMLLRIFALPESVRARYDVSSIRHLGVGAAPVPYALKEQVFRHFGEHCLHEGYGCTEASMIAGLRPDEHRRRPGAAGRPYRHVQVKIVDAGGRPVAPGEIGRILVRTPRMISGYLNGGPLELDADGHFRTGDLGRMDEDGYLHVTGRHQDLIIAGGVNIYPAEIEDVLRGHPAVLDAAVVGVPDPDLGERVAAHVEPRPGAAVTAADLAAFAAPRLATFKRPRSYAFGDLPRNEMGKVLKSRLREESR